MADSSQHHISQCLSEARKRAVSPVRVSIVPIHFAYQSECGDQRAHERHWVEVHWWRHAGQTPPVSNVFHSCPQSQDHRSSLRGDQPQSGQRMRGSDGFRLFSSSSSRSNTTDDFESSFTKPEPNLYSSITAPSRCCRDCRDHGCGTPGGYAPFEVSQGVTCPSSAARRTSSGVRGVNGSPGRTLRARRKFSKPCLEKRAYR
jgi:hypothetical protein